MNIRERLELHKDSILEDYRGKVSTPVIAAKHDCSPAYINTVLKAWGEPIRGRRFTDEEKATMVKMSRDGMTSYGIAKAFKTSVSNVSRFLAEVGIDVSHRRYVNADPVKNHRDEIVRMYIEDWNGVETIARRFNTVPTVINRYLRKWGVQIRTVRDYAHPVNESFFSRIDNELAAYALGVMMSDGSVNEKQITMRIAMTDHDVIEKVARAMNYGGSLKLIEPRGKMKLPQLQLTIGSRKIYNDLFRLGCVPRKSQTAKFPTPDQVPDEFMPALLRGWFDGDGAHYDSKQKGRTNNAWCWFICGTEEVCVGIAEKITSLWGIKCSPYVANVNPKTGHRHAKALISAVEDIKKILDIIYKDSTISMDRKRQKYVEFLRDKFPDSAPTFISGNPFSSPTPSPSPIAEEIPPPVPSAG